MMRPAMDNHSHFGTRFNRNYFQLMFLLTVAVVLTACNDNSSKTVSLGTGTGRVPQSSNSNGKQYNRAIRFNGLVNRDQKDVTAGRIEATDHQGKVIANSELKESARYTIDIPADALYPIILTVYSDSKKSTDEPLILAILDPVTTDYFDITSATTAIAEKALAMGGYNSKNMMRAALKTVAVPDRDKSAGGFTGDPTK